MKVSFSVKGLSELEKKLKFLADDVARKSGIAATRKGAKFLERAILDRAPVGTRPTGRRIRRKSGKVVEVDYGRLTTNIRVRKTPDRKSESEIEFGISRGDAFWAYFLEFGTVDTAPRPFIGPALDAATGDAVSIVGADLGKRIDRAFARIDATGRSA